MGSENLLAVERALDYIEAHLGERLDLDAVAHAAGYSKFHLHRLFSATVGMTVHAYVSRRRLTEAARSLVQTERPVVDIAREAGYDSQQTFSAAFAALYKVPPAHFRECGTFYPLQLPLSLHGPAAGQGARDANGTGAWEVRAATFADVGAWMELMRLAVDGFPHLDEPEHEEWLRGTVGRGQALVAGETESAALVGVVAFDPVRSTIDVLAVHPQYRRAGELDVARALVTAVQAALPRRDLAITTYRAGDRADTGYRRDLAALGFEEAELEREWGYPVQRFVLRATASTQEGSGVGKGEAHE